MTVVEQNNNSPAENRVSLIFDEGGGIQAASSGTAFLLKKLGTTTTDLEIDHSLSTHFAVLFGGKSEISEWLSEQIAIGAEQGEFCAENEFAIGESKAHIRLETLRSDGSLTGFLIQVSDGQPLVPEGSALVQRQQCHDIKNMIGGLKLYASYLLRKLPESEDREIIVKMAKGIDSLIDRLGSIRRGEAK